MGQETPYGRYLQEWLGGSVEIQVRGICGELTNEMVRRFRRDVVQVQPSHVIVLGGTNDLGWKVPPAEIMGNLLSMYELARASQILPVPVTVPSIRVDVADGGPDAVEWVGQHLTSRAELNGRIRAYALSHDLPWIDLFGATVEPVTGQLAAQYSNDGLHLTTSGYRLLAQLLYDQVFVTAFPGRQV